MAEVTFNAIIYEFIFFAPPNRTLNAVCFGAVLVSVSVFDSRRPYCRARWVGQGAYWYRWVPGMGTYANQRQNKRNVHILWHCCGVQSSTMGYNIGYIQSPSFGTAAVAVAAALVVDRLMSSN